MATLGRRALVPDNTDDVRDGADYTLQPGFYGCWVQIGEGVISPKVDAQIVRDVFAKHQVPEPEGIGTDLDVCITDGIAVALAVLNDGGVPFNIIADIIEEAL